MKYPAYPKYKPSGVEWIGDVPKHWKTLALRRCLKGVKDGTHGSYERVIEGMPLLSAKNISGGKVVIRDSESMISIEDWREITSNGYPRFGDVLLTIVGASVHALLLGFGNFSGPHPKSHKSRRPRWDLYWITCLYPYLISKVESAIDLLQEYRSALITAAVTGTIDVRQASQRLEDASTQAPDKGRIAI